MPQVRLGSRDDLVRLLELERRTFGRHALSRRSLRHLLAAPSAIVLVAEHGAHIVGSAVVLLRGSSSVARLYSLAAARRRCGIGSLLLSTAEWYAVSRGNRLMRLEVEASNRAAMALYSSRGYRVVARLPDYYGAHCPGLRMKKVLTVPCTPP